MSAPCQHVNDSAVTVGTTTICDQSPRDTSQLVGATSAEQRSIFYEVRSGYWKYGSHSFAITDDLTYARTLLLQRAEHEVGHDRVKSGMAELERRYGQLVRGVYEWCQISFGDYHYEIRVSQMTVAVGGMSTILNGHASR